MAEATDKEQKKKQELMEELISSLPGDMTKTQKKKQAKIMYRKLKMKEKSKLQKKKTHHKTRATKSMSSDDASKLRVAIELGYSELMSDKDIKMLIKQCQRCYSENRHSVKPLQLYLTSLNGVVKEAMGSNHGYQNWDVHFNEKKYLDIFDQKEIIFLAAESPNVLTELCYDKVYIIGGLVDHNRHKGYCFNEAVAAGISHAQLPLKDHVTLNSRSVLTINHVFEILLKYEECKDWNKAILQVIPQRKLASSTTKTTVTETPSSTADCSHTAQDTSSNSNDSDDDVRATTDDTS